MALGKDVILLMATVSVAVVVPVVAVILSVIFQRHAILIRAHAIYAVVPGKIVEMMVAA